MSALLPIATTKADFPKNHVRFTPESRHLQRNGACLLRANSGHRGIHSITPSAMAITPDGMVKPSACLTESYYKYCSIGASPTVT